MREIKRIGILTSGGDAPGMNAAVRAVVRTASRHGVECIGIRRGWNGLIHGDYIPLTCADVNGMSRTGGTILYTARCKEFMTVEGREKAINTCKALKLDGIVAIGGDGTFQGALALSRQIAQSGHDLPVVGIPATIDNDIGCSDYTIGFDTACNTAIECIDKIFDTMQSHERCSVVEVMGHRAGFLALHVGISEGATAVLIPEREVDFERDVADRIRRARLAGITHFMIVVAEGVGSATAISRRIQEEVGVDSRATVLGHIQRGGAPSSRDRDTAARMGFEAAKVLLAGKGNRVIGTKNGVIIDIDMEEALAMVKNLDMYRYEIWDTLALGGNVE